MRRVSLKYSNLYICAMDKKIKLLLKYVAYILILGVACGALAYLLEVIGFLGHLAWYETLAIPISLTLLLYVVHRYICKDSLSWFGRLVNISMKVMFYAIIIFIVYVGLEWCFASTDADFSGVVWERILLVSICASAVVKINENNNSKR